MDPELVWKFLRKEKPLASGGIRTPYRLRCPDYHCVTGCFTSPSRFISAYRNLTALPLGMCLRNDYDCKACGGVMNLASRI